MKLFIFDIYTFKALSSQTRLSILENLYKNKMNITELSSAIGIKKSTLLTHLDILQRNDLVQRISSDGRKWVYYKLTDKGINLINPKDMKYKIILSTVILSFICGLASLFYFIIGFINKNIFDKKMTYIPPDNTSNITFPPPNFLEKTSNLGPNEPFLYLSIILFILCGIIFYYFIKKYVINKIEIR